jgi:DNA-binding CsgD family transcriptional regulator
MRTGQFEMADRRLREALDLCRQSGDAHVIASTLAGMGELAIRTGKLHQAGNLLQESLNLSRSIGEKWGVPVALGSLGWLALQKRDFESMRSMLGESLSIRAETGDRGGMAWCLEKFAQSAMLQSQYPRAATLFAAAQALRAPVGSVMDPVDQPEHERALSALREALGEQAFATLWSKGQSMSLEEIAQYAVQQPASTPPDSRHTEKEKFGGLTAREREVAAWIAEGKSNREIAETMTVGVRTVETYVTRILNKLGFDSRVQIATWAVEKGLARSRQRE